MTAFFEGVGEGRSAGIWHDAARLPSMEPEVAAPLVEAKASVKMEDF
jgi:hypothetical protein